jgi:hypothetical protein
VKARASFEVKAGAFAAHPLTQSQNPNAFSGSIPNSLTSFRLVETATMCFATESGPWVIRLVGVGVGWSTKLVVAGCGWKGHNRTAVVFCVQFHETRRLTELRGEPGAAGARVEHRLGGGEGLGDDDDEGGLGVESLPRRLHFCG